MVGGPPAPHTSKSTHIGVAQKAGADWTSTSALALFPFPVSVLSCPHVISLTTFCVGAGEYVACTAELLPAPLLSELEQRNQDEEKQVREWARTRRDLRISPTPATGAGACSLRPFASASPELTLSNPTAPAPCTCACIHQAAHDLPQALAPLSHSPPHTPLHPA